MNDGDLLKFQRTLLLARGKYNKKRVDAMVARCILYAQGAIKDPPAFSFLDYWELRNAGFEGNDWRLRK